MQEKADPRLDSQFSQFAAERNQVVVVDPDRVVAAQLRREKFGEAAVDGAVSVQVFAPEVEQVGAHVQQWPERAVGEALVVGRILALVEVGQRVVDLTDAFDGDLTGVLGDDATAPAEPEATVLGQRRIERRSEPAGARLARLGDAIGNDDQSTHRISPHARSVCATAVKAVPPNSLKGAWLN